MRDKWLALVLVCLVGISLPGFSQDTACPPCSAIRAYANRGPNASDLEAVVIRAIQEAPQGSAIGVMVAWFSVESIARALLVAAEDGDDVRVLVRTTSDCVRLVGMGINARRLTTVHHKVAVFGDSVLTGSANWTRTGLHREWNDIVIIFDPEIRDFYWILFNAAWHTVTGCGD